MKFEPIAIALLPLAGLASAGEVIKSGPDTPGGAAAQLVPGRGFACPAPKRWEMVRGMATCKLPDPPVVPPPVKDPPQAAACPAGMTFELQYVVDQDFWPPRAYFTVAYADGSRNTPAMYASTYAFPTFTNLWPLAPGVGGVYRTGVLALPSAIPDGQRGEVNQIPSALAQGATSTYSNAYMVTWVTCSAGKLTEVNFYGCNNCDPG